MEFFLDYLWLLAPILAVAGLGGLFRFLQTGERRWLLTAIALLLGAIFTFLLDRAIETPFEQVRNTLRSIVASAEKQDAEAIVAALASDYFDGTRRHAQMAALVRDRIDDARIDRVGLAGLELAREEGGVTARFVAHVAGSDARGGSRVQSYPVRLKITFIQENDSWKMNAVRRYDIVQSAREVPLDALH